MIQTKEINTHRGRGKVKVVLKKKSKIKVIKIKKPKESTPPKKLPNKERREREYLTPDEIDKLIDAAKTIGRHSLRDATMVLMCYRHGLRVSELINLRWNQVNFKLGLLHVIRSKNGLDTTHRLYGPEIRALRKLKKEYPDTQFVFVTERKGPLTDSTFRKIVDRAGKKAVLGMPIHPHMLRHSTGFKLANDGQDTRAIQHYLGHKNINNTVKYTQLNMGRFQDFWKD